MKNNIKLNKLKPIFVKKKNGVLGQKLGYDSSFLGYRFAWYFYPSIYSPSYILNFKPLVETTTLTFFFFINIGSISEADIPHNIVALLKSKAKGHQNLNSVPDKLSATLSGHTRAVNAIHWSSTQGKFS